MDSACVFREETLARRKNAPAEETELTAVCVSGQDQIDWSF